MPKRRRRLGSPVMNIQRIEPTESGMLSAMTQEMGWDIFYDQLDRGRFSGVFEFTQGGRSQFMSERYSRSLCIHGAVPPGMITFIIVAPRAQEVRFCGKEVTPHTLCVLMPGDEGALSVPADHTFLTCCMDAGLLDDSLRARRRTSLAKVLSRTASIQCPAGEAAGLQGLIEEVCGPAPDGGRVLDQVAEEAALEQRALAVLARALTSREPAPPPELAARNHWRCVRRAREFIEAHLGGAFRMEIICRHTGVSERTLETAFRQVTGMNPRQFIRTRRLNVAREKLLAARASGMSVKEVALTSGFWHLGHFAREYFAHFGELPSTTLARR